MAGSSDKGINIISWNCQYDGIKSIAVQRSSDSIYNFITLGYVKNLKRGVQGYVDGHPLPGKNFYRLYIVFNSDLTWYSNRIKLKVDSAALRNRRVLPPNDSLQKLLATMKFDEPGVNTENNDTTVLSPGLTEYMSTSSTTSSTISTSSPGVVSVSSATPPKPAPKITIQIPEPTEEDGFSYIESQYIFTNPFNGHVNIEIPEFRKYHFNINFFDENDKKVLEIYKVNDGRIILDKRNFKKKGIYRFELKRNMKMFETGHITIF